jgi:hypothetical protein
MSHYQLHWHDRLLNHAGRARIVAMLVLVVGCSGERAIAPRPQEPSPAQATTAKNYSFSITPGDRTVYVQFTRVRSDGTESVSAFVQRMFASADAAGATKLVVDLRSIRGGDSFLVVPLLKGVLTRERFNQSGGLLVVVGDASFSPGQSVAAVLKQYVHPIFVRDPPSSRPIL